MTKEQFIKTEIGVLPQDWKIEQLEGSSDLFARIGWQGLTTNEYRDIGDYYLVTGTDFNNGFIDWNNCVFVDKYRFDQDRKIQLRNSDVLLTKDGTIGKVAFVKDMSKPATLNSGVFVIRPKDQKFDASYFYYVLNSNYFRDFLNKINAGSTIIHLYQKDFVKFKFPLPPLQEQRKIAEALSDCDAWIESIKKLIEKKKLIKEGVMQKLLEPKEDWTVEQLGKIINVQRGGSPRPIQAYITNDTDGINWIKIGDTSPTSKYIVSCQEKIIREGERNSRKVQSGDFLLSNSMSFGRPYILKIDGCIHDGWLVLQDYQDSFDTEFLYYLLSSKLILDQYKSKAAGSSVLNLNKELVQSIELKFPSVEVQRKISKILCDIDLNIEVLELKLQKAQNIKQGMMQDLLTGKVRLV